MFINPPPLPKKIIFLNTSSAAFLVTKAGLSYGVFPVAFQETKRKTK